MVSDSVFMELLGNKSFVAILDALLDRLGNGNDFNKKEIIDASGLSDSSIHNLWDKLMEFNLIVRTRKLGHIQMYRINTYSPLWKKLVELDVEASMQVAP